MKTLLTILFSPLQSIITHWSGYLGNYARRSFYKNKLIYLGRGAIIDEGAIIKTPEHTYIGDKSHIDKNVMIDGKVLIGNYVHIAENCLIQGGSLVKIGNFVGIASGTKIYSATDTVYNGLIPSPLVPKELRNPLRKGQVNLEDHVFIGANCVILPNVTIGEGSVIGACSLVLKNIPAWKVCYGIPARPIKNRPKINPLGSF